MTCAVCKYEWCWVCGLPYKSIIHFAALGGLMCEFVGMCHFKLKGFCSYFVLVIITIFLPLLVLFFSCIVGGAAIFFCFSAITSKRSERLC